MSEKPTVFVIDWNESLRGLVDACLSEIVTVYQAGSLRDARKLLEEHPNVSVIFIGARVPATEEAPVPKGATAAPFVRQVLDNPKWDVSFVAMSGNPDHQEAMRLAGARFVWDKDPAVIPIKKIRELFLGAFQKLTIRSRSS